MITFFDENALKESEDHSRMKVNADKVINNALKAKEKIELLQPSVPHVHQLPVPI